MYPEKLITGKRTVLNKDQAIKIVSDLRTKGFIQPTKNLQKPTENLQVNIIKKIIQPILQAQNEFNLKLLQEIREIKEKSVKQIEYKQDYYSILGYCNLKQREIKFSEAIRFGRECVKLSKEKGIEIRKIPDERFGQVNSYRLDILEEIFSL